MRTRKLILLTCVFVYFSSSSLISQNRSSTAVNQPVIHAGLPVVSPDGKHIAFTSNRTGNVDLYVISANGLEEKQLTHTPAQEVGVQWSADATRIMFSVFENDVSRIYSIGLAGNKQRELGTVPGRTPIFSPDGKRMIYMAGTWTNTRLMAFDGSKTQQLTDGSSFAWNINWSPNGKQVAFTGPDRVTNGLAIFVMNADGTDVRQISEFTAAEGRAQGPRWSPDGRQLAFQVGKPQSRGAEIWVIELASGARKVLTTHDQPYLDESPSWFPNGKLIAFQSNRTGRMEVWVMNVDGTNQRQLTGNSQSKTATESGSSTDSHQVSNPKLVLQQSRTVTASRGGTAQSFKISSQILNETRDILVVLPGSFSVSAPERRYPVTIVVDGEYLLPTLTAVSDELTRNGQIPESIIVGIENVGGLEWRASNEKRVYDLTPPGLSISGSNLNQGGDRFLDFIEKELLPAVDEQFRTAAPRTFIGVSSGGVLATYVAATRPSFRVVISIDAPIHADNNWLAKKLIARAAAAGPPIRYASFEAKFGWPEEMWQKLIAIAPVTWTLYREKFKLEGHETLHMLAAYIGLRQLFGDYSRFSYPQIPTTSVLSYYSKLSDSLGANLIPPKRVLRDVIDDLLMEGRGGPAHEAYNTFVSAYGPLEDSAGLLANIKDVERRPPPTETVEGLLSTPFPTPDAARAFIGEWVGQSWIKPDEPRRESTLRIVVENGRVVAEVLDPNAPPEFRIRRMQYLRVTPAGLTWGIMNGMRPRGMILFEGKLDGDTLSGTSRFGGIDFRMPDGSRGGIAFFSYKRSH